MLLLRKIGLKLRAVGIHQLATQKYKEGESAVKGYFIKNENLHFQDSDSHLYLSPMYPQLTHKGESTFTISSERVVMYFKFIPKAGQHVKTKLYQKTNEQSKSQEHYFSFKYSHLSALVGIEANSGLSTVITRPKSEILEVKDDPKNRQVHFFLRKGSEINQKSAKNLPISFRFSCDYIQYRVMQNLLKKSLFDLSGMHLVHEVKRMEELGEIEKSVIQSKKKLKSQIDEFYQQN